MKRTLGASLLATLMVALLALAAGFGRGAHAGQAIDISGDWTIHISGPIEVDCDASITQTGSDLAFVATCAGIPIDDLSGSIDSSTGAFTATGSIIGYGVDIAATVAADGNSFAGTWSTFIGSGTLTGTRATPAATPTPLPTLSAPVDVSGTWRVTFSGIFGGSCVSVFEQTGSDLESAAQCDIIGGLQLSGTIDPTTGALSLRGGGISLEGAVHDGGDAISGTWDAFGFVTGTFTASRADDVPLIDLSGDWSVILSGDRDDACSLTIEQTLLSATAALDCDTLGSVELDGTVSPLTGFVLFFGSSQDIEVFLTGGSSPDGAYITGSWSQRDVDGTFIAVPSGELARGILAVDCDTNRSGLQSHCVHMVGDTFQVQLVAVAPPEGGYLGFNALLDWEGSGLGFVHSDETLLLDCGLLLGPAVISPIPPVLWGCAPSTGSGAISFTGPIAQADLTCAESGSTDLTLNSGSVFFVPDASSPFPVLVGATVSCYGSQHSGPGSGEGDANGDSRVNSIDAAVVLQYDAGLTRNLGCMDCSDTNHDGRVNSVDATVILQVDAGLIQLG